MLRAPKDTAYMRWSCHSSMASPVQIVSTPPAPSTRAPLPFFWASQPCRPAEWLNATQTTVHASQAPQQLHPQHRVPRQPHRQNKDYHRTTNTTQAHRPSSKSEGNLIRLQVNINGLKNQSANTNYNKHFHQISPRCLHTLYNRTSWTTQHALLSDHLPIISTINIRHDYNKTDGHSPTTRKLTGHKSCKTQSLLSLRPP